jgi:hypothetical protein
MKVPTLRNCKYLRHTKSRVFIYLESLSILTDGDILMASLDPTLFPGVPSTVKAHQGFLDAQAQTASKTLAEVRSLLSQHDTHSLTLVSVVV